MKAAGGSVPVWTAGVSRCVSQACKKNKEPVFEVKFIREEERGADSFLKHPHHPFPPTHPQGGACERMGEGRGGAEKAWPASAPRTKGLLVPLKHPGENPGLDTSEG